MCMASIKAMKQSVATSAHRSALQTPLFVGREDVGIARQATVAGGLISLVVLILVILLGVPENGLGG